MALRPPDSTAEGGGHRVGDLGQRAVGLGIRVQGKRQAGDRQQRRRVRLRGRDRELRAGREVEHVIGGDGRAGSTGRS